jgi:serine protease AprX
MAWRDVCGAPGAFGAIPTPLRVRADPRFTGRGATIALVDAGFYPHPDLVQPTNRIGAWVDATREDTPARWFGPGDLPAWPEPEDAHRAGEWHGLMTSTTAAGNGWLSGGFYRGVAPESNVVLAQVSDAGRIRDESIARALTWLRRHAGTLNLRVVSLSVGGDDDGEHGSRILAAIDALVDIGVVVIAAAGNDGTGRLVPPASAAAAITVGGLDDHNARGRDTWTLWHSNYGATLESSPKPEVVAPSLWTVAPILPKSEVERSATQLFAARTTTPSADVEHQIAARRLVTPHYQHVEGTSFAAPIVAGVVACMYQANPRLKPARIKEILMLTATRIPSAPDERQGAGVVEAGLAVAAALSEGPPFHLETIRTPIVRDDTIAFVLRDPSARSVAILGSWDGWRTPGVTACETEQGVWNASLPRLPNGSYTYKYLLNNETWMLDPANPLRRVDDDGHVNSVLELSCPDSRDTSSEA